MNEKQKQDARVYEDAAIRLRLYNEMCGYQKTDGEFFHVWGNRINHTIVRNHCVVFSQWIDVAQLPEVEKRKIEHRNLLLTTGDV